MLADPPSRVVALKLFLIFANTFQGTVYPAGNDTGPPYVASPFAIPDQSDSMLYLAFSEYFFQTSSFAYYTAGAFNITITEEVSRTQSNRVTAAQVIQDGALACQLPVPGLTKLLIGLQSPERVHNKHQQTIMLFYYTLDTSVHSQECQVPLSEVLNTGNFATKNKVFVDLRY